MNRRKKGEISDTIKGVLTALLVAILVFMIVYYARTRIVGAFNEMKDRLGYIIKF